MSSDTIFSPGPTPNTVRAADGTVKTVPDGWVLLPPGDPGLTRRVKAAGDHWIVKERRGGREFTLGMWAASTTIDRIRAELDAERSTEKYARKKELDTRHRERVQAEYVKEFHEGVLAFLAFHPHHADLAERLARAVTDHTTPVGSGTVARTKRIPVQQRAEAAVIAWMRHQTTAYDSLVIPRVKGKRREVRRMLAQRSQELLERYSNSIGEFTPDDYRHLCGLFFGKPRAKRLNLDKVHRFAPKLNAHQLKGACQWFKAKAEPDTESFIEYLRSRELASNVSLGEVATVALDDLKGIDDLIEQLEANIALPLENDELAAKLSLRPKRGVLLVGPPGTGKTTVGRALAHRLKGKFFLIDGTFISGTEHFYGMIHRVFQEAKDNAPSVIFIDDSDVIFESGREHGLYRYLLTMLDGLESKSAGRVCVMMTAMDVGNLPPALIRSGRIELWLETRLPDEPARCAILTEQMQSLPDPLRDVDVDRLAAAATEFTGADLKRVVEDAKALYAFDQVRRVESRPMFDYYLQAIVGVRENKERYAQAEARARVNRPDRPVWFQPFASAAIGDDE